jgi:hypothetical protein
MSHPATLPLRMHVSPSQGAPPSTSHRAGKSLNQGPQPPTRRLPNGEFLSLSPGPVRLLHGCQTFPCLQDPQ